ncbi:MAG: DUF389 domain-containing protein [Parafilimonas sp.]
MKRFFIYLFDLHKGQADKLETLKNITDNISFRGANLWTLVCAILIASVGLNVNSGAVIIGAMLISPLMGPIVGAGFSLGIYDFTLLRKSLNNLLIATIAGLIVSTIYFYLSPFKQEQSELLARTSPNIYDVMIAFFGGLVGVIAVTRVEKGNPIPGVAIATALMPPLCTAGYGLATGHYSFFFGALFLYSINCVFICIATYLIVKYLKYPAKKIEIKHEKRVKYSITALIILLLAPSAYFAYSLYQQQKFTEAVNTFIEKEFTNKGEALIYKKTNLKNNPKTIELAFLTKHFNRPEIKQLNSQLNKYGIYNTRLIIKQDTTFNISNLKNDILNEVKINDTLLYNRNAEISALKSEAAKNSFDNKELLKEVSAIYPGISAISVSNHTIYTNTDSSYTEAVLIYQAKRELGSRDKLKLANWIKQRLSLNNVIIFKQQKP